jgi:predicted ribosome quality control (RQC) complex YloA/Tae2 family protein
MALELADRIWKIYDSIPVKGLITAQEALSKAQLQTTSGIQGLAGKECADLARVSSALKQITLETSRTDWFSVAGSNPGALGSFRDRATALRQVAQELPKIYAGIAGLQSLPLTLPGAVDNITGAVGARTYLGHELMRNCNTASSYVDKTIASIDKVQQLLQTKISLDQEISSLSTRISRTEALVKQGRNECNKSREYGKQLVVQLATEAMEIKAIIEARSEGTDWEEILRRQNRNLEQSRDQNNRMIETKENEKKINAQAQELHTLKGILNDLEAKRAQIVASAKSVNAN